MIKIQVDLVKFNKDFEKFKNQFELILRIVAVDFTRKFLASTIYFTKIGNAEKYMEYYLQRQKEYGYLPIQGLAKGSWITKLNSPSNDVAGVYDSLGNGKASVGIFEPEMKNFKLGDTVYITNKLHYIELDANGDKAIAYTYSTSTVLFKQVVDRINNKVLKRGA